MFAVTVAAAFRLKVHVFALLPPLEHAPDQIASLPLLIESRMLVPDVNDACMLPPAATLIPAGLEVTSSPLRPVALTVSVIVDAAGGAAGFTVKGASADRAPALAKIVSPV